MNSSNSLTVIYIYKIPLNLQACLAENKLQNSQNIGRQRQNIERVASAYPNIPLPRCLLDGYSRYFSDILTSFPYSFLCWDCSYCLRVEKHFKWRSHIFNNTSNIIWAHSEMMGPIANYMFQSLISWSDYFISSSHFKRAKKLMLFTSCI